MVVYKYKKKDNDMTVYRRSMMEALAEVRGIQTEAMSSAQIDKLKKAYEPMRDKKISVSNANKLSAMMDKFAKDKETLIQLFKADIPFVSKSAVTQLITKHGMKGAEINKFREEFGVKSVDIDELTKKQKQLDVDKDGDIGSDDLAALRKKAGGPYGGKLKKEEDELDEAKRMPPMDDADIQGMYRQVIQLMKHGRSQSSALKYAAKDVGATKKETAKVKQKLDKTGFKEEADLDEIAPVVVGALRAVAAKKVASKGYEKADDEDEEVELDEKTKWKMGDGRPRGGSHIENERFWDLPKSSLEYIIKDAGEAMKLNPTARKATTGRGNWADQVNDAQTVLGWRKKNSIKEEVELDEGKMKAIANDIEAYIKKWVKTHGDLDKDDFMKVASMLRKGDKSGAVKYAKKYMDTDPRDKILDMMGEEVELDEATGKEIAAKMMKDKTMKAFAPKVAKMKSVTADDLEKMLPDYVAGGDIVKLFAGYMSSSYNEASARRDAMRAMRSAGEFKDKDDDDMTATDADVKAASKNILMQMRKASNLGGKFEVEFLDKKKVKVKPEIANAFIKKYEDMRKPADKEKFQNQAMKSYKDMLKALKDHGAIEKKDFMKGMMKTGYNEETILDRITRKLKENKNG